MQGIWSILGRLKGYKKYLILSVIFNILLSVFTIVSVPVLIPFFQLLFDQASVESISPDNTDIANRIKIALVDFIHQYGQQKVLVWICLLLIVIFFLKNLFRFLASYVMAPLRNGIVYDIRQELYQKFLRLPLGFYSGEKKGNLMSVMMSDVNEVEVSIVSMIETIIKSPIIIIGSISFMLYVSPSLTLFVFVLLIFTGIFIGRVSKSLKATSIKVQQSLSNLTSLLEETLGGIRITKAFQGEKYQMKKFSEENTEYKQFQTEAQIKRDLASPLSEFLGVTVVIALMWFGSLLVFKHELAPETFFVFIIAFYQVIEPAKSFTTAYYNIQKGQAALDRVNYIMDQDEKIFDLPNSISITGFHDHIRFENVSFGYTPEGTQAVSNVNYNFQKGQVVALVGSSGAGKSTMMDLLLRFYDPSIGKIIINNQDIKTLKLAEYRKLFGVVSQEPILFNDSIRNNIAFGDAGCTDEDIKNAAIAANAHDFIVNLPQGYDTTIGDRGMNLSGGQRQRITIARAILKSPPILILDEATSALDVESEKLVQEALSNIMKSRTSFVIAHRLSTIQDADVILVMENGQIVETGNHQDLLSQNGFYHRYVNMQALN